MDCGPACLRMIAKYYGKDYSLNYLRDISFITREGVTMSDLSEAAEKIGFKTLGVKITLDQLTDSMELPCILHWDQNHFVVCYKIKGKGNKRNIYVDDPAIGKVTYTIQDLYKHWISGKIAGEDIGIAMQIIPGVDFGKTETQDEDNERMRDMSIFMRHILPHKGQIAQLLLGALVVMLLNYWGPFLSQSVVDIGIKNHDLNFISFILIAQLIISVSQTAILFVNSWMSLRMNTAININLLSDYLDKLTKMPIRFFDIKTMGDILQRMGDFGRVKGFLMNNMISFIFSLGTFIVFSIVLGIYQWRILLIFMIGNTCYIIWILSFMKYRRELDNKTFVQSAKSQNNMVQFIQGMTEIKLNCIERQKRWEWEHIQANLYRITVKSLKLGQIQSVGSFLFSSTTNILISYLAAKMVVSGEISLGMMMSLSFIIGQVSGPISSIIGFACSYQDAKISLERLNDINSQDDEMVGDNTKISIFPNSGEIRIKDVSFSYSGSERDYVLKNISTTIHQNKVTAIVGASGCGKTTLVKILQGLYQPSKGVIYVGETPLQMIKTSLWRTCIGSVMQDGYIFSDTIANNIAIDKENIDNKQLSDAVNKACLTEYINSLPLNYNTKIGAEGIGLSQGQKQRVLLARAIYKNPKYLFLDEATNALDTCNEKIIIENLKGFCQGKTVVIAAHRLSTIKDADNIIVMDHGKIVEQGTHQFLVNQKGYYYNLIQKQLEL